MNKQEIEKAAFNINAPKVKNIIGEKYGRLTVIEQRGFTKPNKHGSSYDIDFNIEVSGISTLTTEYRLVDN